MKYFFSINTTTQKFKRGLITCIFDKNEAERSQLPVYTEENNREQPKIKDEKK